MGQAPPTGTTSWDRPRPRAQLPRTAGNPASRISAAQTKPHLVCIFTISHRRPSEPAQEAGRHFTRLIITFSPKGGPAPPGPRGAVPPGFLCLSGALSPLWL